jgi:hypothetical protein
MSAFGLVKAAAPLNVSDTIDFSQSGGSQSYFLTNSNTVGVTRTFDPIGYPRDGVARWVDRSGGIQVGYPWFDLSIRPPVNNGARVNRITLTLTLPTLEQTSASTASGIQPAPTKAYDHVFKGEWLFPERGLRWERKASLMMLASLLFGQINALDGSPADVTGSPLPAALLDFDRPY